MKAIFSSSDMDFLNSSPSSPELDPLSSCDSSPLSMSRCTSPGVNLISSKMSRCSSPEVSLLVKQVPSFLLKLWSIVDNPATDSLVSWSRSGTAFIIKDTSQFTNVLLPFYFKHANLSSFIRQLNMYGFTKLMGVGTFSDSLPEFKNLYFIRDQQNFLVHIRRNKKNSSEIRRSEQGMRSTQGSISEQGGSFKALAEIADVRTKQVELSAEFVNIKDENKMLWGEILSLRQKHSEQQKMMTDIMKFLVPLVTSEKESNTKKEPQTTEFQPQTNDLLGHVVYDHDEFIGEEVILDKG